MQSCKTKVLSTEALDILLEVKSTDLGDGPCRELLFYPEEKLARCPGKPEYLFYKPRADIDTQNLM